MTLQKQTNTPPYPPEPKPEAAPEAVAAGPCILQVLPRLETGGVERGTVDIAGALARAGWRPVVASAGGPMVRELERVGAVHLTLPVDSKNPFVMRKNVDRLAEIIAKYRVDLVHARSRAPAWSAWYAARRAHVPFVTTFHGTYNVENRFKRWYNGIMTRGHRVIAISEFIGHHIVSTYGISPSLVRIIPRGIDIVNFDVARVSAERVMQLARTWRLPDGVPIIMLPGRLTRWKGQTVLIEALAKLGRRDICCLLVGSDQGRASYRAEIEQLVRAKGLEGIVRAVDECRDMPAAFKLADVVVHASTDPEAFGRVIAEAQAMGRPVIATDQGGAPEIVQPGVTGWLVPPGDADALAAALREALSLTAEQRAELSATASARVREYFSREQMCASTLAVYEEVLNEAAGAARP
jgi:glycosyltransferase involved in cell wall biosynthesis